MSKPQSSLGNAGRKRVVVGLRMDSDLMRSVMEGVVCYAREHRGWSMAFSHNADSVRFVEELWPNSDGVLFSNPFPDGLALMERVQCPRVGILMGQDIKTFPTVTDDARQIVELGIDHLRSVGFRRLAYIDLLWKERPRRRAFVEHCANLGVEAIALPESYDNPPNTWDQQRGLFLRWVKELPKPIGVITHHMELAHHLAEACHAEGVRIPEEIGIVGHGGGEFQSHLAWPPISYIDAGAERIGYAAAEMLDRQMNGQVLKPQRLVIDSLGVVKCQSTDLLSVEDPDVAAALRFIRGSIEDAVVVEDVLAVVTRSRRSLEYAFEKTIGRTIHQEIIRSRIELAKQLLRDTDLKTIEIAVRCGFNSASRLSAIFKQHLSQSPTEYRRRFHGRSSRI